MGIPWVEVIASISKFRRINEGRNWVMTRSTSPKAVFFNSRTIAASVFDLCFFPHPHIPASGKDFSLYSPLRREDLYRS